MSSLTRKRSLYTGMMTLSLTLEGVVSSLKGVARSLVHRRRCMIALAPRKNIPLQGYQGYEEWGGCRGSEEDEELSRTGFPGQGSKFAARAGLLALSRTTSSTRSRKSSEKFSSPITFKRSFAVRCRWGPSRSLITSENDCPA